MLIKQNVFDGLPLKNKSIQLIVTSPPYFSLRKYDIPEIIIGGDINCPHEFKSKDGFSNPLRYSNPKQNIYTCQYCHAWKGNYGLEPDFNLYLSHTMLWIQECWRVLKDDGCLFINIGDSYNNQSYHIGREDKNKYGGKNAKHCLRGGQKGYPVKSKFCIPERLIVKMVDSGWLIRNHIVWHKKNSCPESVRDRFSKRWETIIFATKSPDYYFNLNAIREPYKETSIKRIMGGFSENNKSNIMYPNLIKNFIPKMRHKFKDNNYKGKNPGDIWEIAAGQTAYRHFAIYPEKLVKRIILCSTKEKDIVLDPFCGIGTTVKVAIELNRIGIGIDIGYQEIQRKYLLKIQKKLPQI